jgi:hypothetical protein
MRTEWRAPRFDEAAHEPGSDERTLRLRGGRKIEL